MAIGTFANLAPAQLQLAQSRAASGDLLGNLLQGLQQGVQLQQLPQQIQNQALAQQLAAQLNQAKLESIPLERERQGLLLDQLRAQLDPNYQAQKNAAQIAFEVDKARQLGQVANEFKLKIPDKFDEGFFDQNSGRYIKRINGQIVASQIPFAESLGSGGVAPSVSASDIPSIDPKLFSGTSIIPTTPTPSRTTLSGAIEQRAKIAEDQKKEDRAFRQQLQEDAQTFRSEQAELQREYLQGKDAAKPPKFNKADEVTVNNIAKDNAAKISILNQLLAGAQTFTDPKISDEVKAVEGARLGKILNSTEGKDALQEAERNALLPFLNFEVGNPRGLFDPTRKVFGRNLPAFQQQLDATASSLSRVIDYNNKYIDSVYQKYGQSFTPDSAINISKGDQGSSIQKKEGESSKDYLKRKYGR